MSSADKPTEAEAPSSGVIGTFAPGDRVVARSDIPARSAAVSARDRPSVGVVVEATGERAGDKLLSTGETVAEYNSDLGDFENDLVVKVAFIDGSRGLKSTLGEQWNDGPDAEIRKRIREFKAEWSVGPKLYPYPESRLLSTDAVDLERFEQ